MVRRRQGDGVTGRPQDPPRWSIARLRHRGQGGFAILTALAIWMMVSSVVMVALLGMTVSVTEQAQAQEEEAQQVRAVDGALETAVVVIQTDPSGKVAVPTGKDDGCAAGLDHSGDALVLDDGLGDLVSVTAACSGPTDADAVHRVVLTADVFDEDGTPALAGRAELDVVKAKGPGSDVTVLTWAIGEAATKPLATTTTTTTTTVKPTTTTTTTTTTVKPTTTTTTTTVKPTTTTTTTTTTSVPSDGIVWSDRVTAEWQSGYCVEVTVSNTGKSSAKWTIQVPVKGTIYTSWSAKYTRSGNTLTAVGESWNATLKSGDSTTWGWCSNF